MAGQGDRPHHEELRYQTVMATVNLMVMVDSLVAGLLMEGISRIAWLAGLDLDGPEI